MTDTVLVTGAAGFIGSHAVEHLLAKGFKVRGADCFDDYYDVRRKRANLEEIGRRPGFEFVETDLRARDASRDLCKGVDVVLHAPACARRSRTRTAPTR